MGCCVVNFMFLLGCLFPKKKKKRKKRVKPTEEEVISEEVTVVESIYLPLELQSAMEEPRPRESEQEVISQLKIEGLLKSETLNETSTGKSFYVSLDGNPYPSGKPRLLEPIDLRYGRDKLQSDHDTKMAKAARNRKQKLTTVKRRARIVSNKVRQAQIKEDERRLALKERLDRKMEQAARNRLLSRGK